jgi:hypothetical protein
MRKHRLPGDTSRAAAEASRRSSIEAGRVPLAGVAGRVPLAGVEDLGGTALRLVRGTDPSRLQTGRVAGPVLGVFTIAAWHPMENALKNTHRDR